MNATEPRNSTDKGAILFLTPALLIYLSVIILPIIYSLFVSLHKWNGISEMTFVGVSNYVNLIVEDDIFRMSLINNGIWILLTIFITMPFSLLLANMLSTPFKGRTFFRGLFYCPMVISGVAVGIIWRWLYNPNIGFFTELFKILGISYRQTWTSSANSALLAVFFASFWQSAGAPMIYFLAGLQAISPDVLEASIIDGASPVQQFFLIKIPLLKNTFVVVFATLITGALKVFDIIKSLTDGGPHHSTEMLSTYMYSQVFRYNNVGYGTAVAVIMFLLMLLIVAPYVKFTIKSDK